MGIIQRKKALLMDYNPLLPPGYKRVEYIRAITDAYIDTGYVPTQYDSFEVEYMVDVNSGNKCLLSAGTSTYQLIILTYVDLSGYVAYYYRFFSSGSALTFVPRTTTNVWYKMTISEDGVLSVNGNSIQKAYGSELNGDYNSLYIFRRRNGNNPFIGKLKSFKITNKGTMKLNLIPCIHLSDSKAGVYDTVSKIFYSSAGTEEFTPSTLDN